MPNKKGQKKVVNNSTVAPVIQPKVSEITISTMPAIEKPQHIDEEKVEVLIKEVIRINPRDFSAFKHALEDFVNSWDK
jgi:hypothetical protein